jgi:mercuric ion transport protein
MAAFACRREGRAVRNVARGIHLGAIWLFTACAVVQVFLAGLGVFVNPARFELHRDFGYTFGLLLLVVIVAAILGRLGRRQIGFAVVLMVLYALQSVFVAMRGTVPEIAALHPVNGFLIIAVASVAGREAWAAWRARVPETAATGDGSGLVAATTEEGHR